MFTIQENSCCIAKRIYKFVVFVIAKRSIMNIFFFKLINNKNGNTENARFFSISDNERCSSSFHDVCIAVCICSRVLPLVSGTTRMTKTTASALTAP